MADFNSRPSARGDDAGRAAENGARKISIHAPPRGATGFLWALIIKQQYFNSRPSARGDKHRPQHPDERNISIHAPPRGATGGVIMERGSYEFQFTPLREGRHVAIAFALTLDISIHAPPRGATAGAALLASRGKISIHAPPRGATIIVRVDRGQVFKFQFTPLREGRRRDEGQAGNRVHFNSRPSARGDEKRVNSRLLPFYFNSRPSARGDSASCREDTPPAISIHAPPRGATFSRFS